MISNSINNLIKKKIQSRFKDKIHGIRQLINDDRLLTNDAKYKQLACFFNPKITKIS